MQLIKVLGMRGAHDILFTLMKEGTMSFSKLSSLTKYSTTASRTLKALRRHGLIERKVEQDERRSVVYKLTKKGKEVAELLTKLDTIERNC